MRDSFEFDCVYGSGHTESTGYYYGNDYNGWYVVHGSCNVNYTQRHEIDEDGVTDVEEINDYDTCSSLRPINSIEELVRFIDDVDEDDAGDEEE